jgi:uncharacterized membrane protein YgcG
MRSTPVHSLIHTMLAALLLLGALVWLVAAPAATSQGDDTGTDTALSPRFDPEQRLFDNANLLTEDQDKSFEGDLARASGLGIEMVVFTRVATDDEQASQAFADQIRSSWQVESEPGANDGIVILLTYDFSNLKNHSIVVSAGDNAFPIRQLTADGYESILNDEMRPELEAGNFDFALMYGVRRILNYAEYSPPNPAPRTDRQVNIGNLAAIAAAVTLQATVLGFVIAGALSRHRLTFRPSPRALAWYGLALAGTAAITGVLGIAGRNGPATLIALAVFVWACVGVPLIATLDSRSRRQRVRVTSTRHRPTHTRAATVADRTVPEVTAHA